jgi:hypothetical protein
MCRAQRGLRQHLDVSLMFEPCTRLQVSLYDVLPAACIADAVKIFEDFQRDL